MLFSLFYCDSFGFIRGKTQKIEKSNLFISFSLYFQCSNFFLAVRKYFKNGSLGTKNGPSDPLKFLVSLEISKLGPLAHFYSLLNHFIIFLTARKIFLIEKREKQTNKVLLNGQTRFMK